MNTPTVTIHPRPSYSVSPRSRRRLLDVLESTLPATDKQAAQLCGLSEKTLRRARKQLVAEGILLPHAPSYARRDGLLCRFYPARYAALPVLELGASRLLLRWGDTHLESVFAVVRERGYGSDDEDLAWLWDQTRRILHAGVPSLTPRSPILQPVLLHREGEQTSHLRGSAETFLTRLGGHEPVLTLTVTEAVAGELIHHPAAQGATLVLYVCLDPTPTVLCFLRSGEGTCFLPLPHGEIMGEALRGHLRRYALSSTPAKGLSAFFREACVGFPPDAVILESAFTDGEVSECKRFLPRHTIFSSSFTDLNTPTLAHKGAMRKARRMLWERMGEK